MTTSMPAERGGRSAETSGRSTEHSAPSDEPRGRVGERGDVLDPLCPTRQLLDRIGTKWTSIVVKVLAEAEPGELRFAELRRRVPGVSQKMLSVTLQSLVRDGLVVRRVEATVPPAVHYRLTELGLSLEEPLSSLRVWAETHMAAIDRSNRLAEARQACREE
ncbi:helix-turn-helix domain-containing protein [Streptomyces sp. NBC_00083]|uniref:winged helix-turn-helix transcriptional regulator n=1 Tax=Streptomyces sp. NBC_00083 TaxID=2975647 RepID=UPI002259E356|nr:helix-turn-helix domain-containing protein [Streptomyces sp. NBC_00083]MCX5387351.1 helix-turn-helix transcriptional regulator [Streptomyces sp. NBC_00083]